MARNRRASDDDAEWTPAIQTWTQEASMLATVIDKLSAIQHVLLVVNSQRDKKPTPPKPYPIPVTAMSRAIARSEYQRRKAKHESLVARVLPNREA